MYQLSMCVCTHIVCVQLPVDVKLDISVNDCTNGFILLLEKTGIHTSYIPSKS